MTEIINLAVYGLEIWIIAAIVGIAFGAAITVAAIVIMIKIINKMNGKQ